MKKILIILGIIIILGVVIFVLVMSGAFSVFMPKPPEPAITHAEFPIKVIYAINGKKQVVDDIVVCDYAGVESLGTAGKYRKWNSYLKSGNKKLILLNGDYNGKQFKITTDFGQAEYYMGDYRFESKLDHEEKMKKSNYLGLYYFNEDGDVTESKTITYEQARDDYGIDIIEIQYSQPISNKFE